MRTKILKNTKLVIRVESRGKDGIIITKSVFDNRINDYWSKEQITERNIWEFLNLQDLKECLNWYLNGDESKYQFKWGMTAGGVSEGVAYVFH